MYLEDGKVRKYRRSSEATGCAHELTFSCYHRLPLLSKERTREWLIQAMHAARRKHDLEYWAYVIMPEHVHLLFMPRRLDYRMPAILQSIKQPVMRRAINFLRESKTTWIARLTSPDSGEIHFWQPGGGYDRSVYRPKTAWTVVEYIHNNPVKRGLVDRPADWNWSSASWYEGTVDVPIAMDSTPPEPGER